MDLTKLQVAYQNVVAEIAKAYLADYDFVADPRRLIAAERACFSLLKQECAARLRVHPNDLPTLKFLSGSSNLHRETARLIRKAISRQPEERELHREGQESRTGPQAEAEQTAKEDGGYHRQAEHEGGGQTQQESDTTAEQQHSPEGRQSAARQTQISISDCELRTAITWLILFAAFLLYEYWWVVEWIIEGVLVVIEMMLFAVVWFALAAIMY